MPYIAIIMFYLIFEGIEILGGFPLAQHGV